MARLKVSNLKPGPCISLKSFGDLRGSRAGTKRPFEDEDDELQSRSSNVKAHSKALSSIFGDEPSEDESGPKPRPHGSDKPFGDEGCESDQDGSDSSNDESYMVKTESVFTFGWNSVATFKKATFWRENMNDEKAKRPKRTYDNSKREAAASYTRKKSRGFFKRNGVDPARLQKLFGATSCACAFVCSNLAPTELPPYVQHSYLMKF